MEDALNQVIAAAEINKSSFSGSAKKIFGSFEKGIDKVVGFLTPRKWSMSSQDEPRTVKATYSVSTTSSLPPDVVLDKIKDAVAQTNINVCKQKG